MALDRDLDSDGQFCTKHTALAAYLYMSGFDLQKVDNSEFPTVFIFEDSRTLREHERQFQVAKAEGNLVLFFDSYRKCLRMTKVGKL